MDSVKEIEGVLSVYRDRIDSQIELIEDELYEQTGVWLRRHRYTADEIKRSKNFSKLISIQDKIFDDVQRWQEAGVVTEDVQDVYRMFRCECKNKRRKLLKNIKNRKRTSWERFIVPLTEVCEELFEKLPIVIKLPLKMIAKSVGLPDFVRLLEPSRSEEEIDN